MISIKFKKQLYSNNRIFYLIVIVSTKIKPSSGKFIEKIGYYNPSLNKWSHKSIYINMDRLFFWLKKGVKLNKSLYILIKPMLIYLIDKKNYEL